MEQDDEDAIKKATEELEQSVQQLSIKLYEQMQQQQAQPQGSANASKKDDNVVDAEYEEVKEDK